MSTYLLRNVYPPVAAEDVEPASGCACNDERYVTEGSPVTTLQVDVIATPVCADAENDDYYLGGYAGI